MSDVENINGTLSQLIGYADQFKLDDRSDQQLLQALSDYVQLIPFDDASQSWADFFFMTGKTPEILGGLSSGSAAADGTLLPQQAFLMAFLKLVRTPRALLNYFPLAHRELYYRTLLGLSEKPARPDSVVLTFGLSKAAQECFVPAGTLFDAGKDNKGAPVQYSLDQSLLVNQSVWTDLRWIQPDSTLGAQEAGGTTPALATVAFDHQLNTWPASGLTLFDPQASSEPVVSGRLVASAALAMSSGVRTYTLTFDSTSVNSADLSVARISSGSNWLDLVLPSPSTNATTVVLTLSAQAGAVSAPQDLDGITMDMPVIKLGTVNGQTVPAITALDVQVDGNDAVLYSTDNGVNPVNALSYPFGTSPVVGRGFNLISPDWCNDVQAESFAVTVTPQWIGLPAGSFTSWYTGYDADVAPNDNNDFTVSARWMSATGSTSDSTSTALQPLFKSGSTVAPAGAALTIVLPSPLPASATRPADPCDWPAWVRFELTPRDFGHQDYQKLAGTKPLNPPYTPQSSTTLVSYKIATAAFEQYVLTPFGYAVDGVPVGDFTKSYLYVGLTGGSPGETLSLYWQLQSPQSLAPSWQYLNQSNAWASLESSLVDGTQGLKVSGLWTTTLPHDAASDVTWMPQGRYWVRAIMDSASAPLGNTGVGEPTVCYAWLQGLAANSMTATLNAPDTLSVQHFVAPLPAGTITRPVAPVDGLGEVSQPWPSWGGQAAEQPAQFFTRAAQRLSHRNRAVTWQDMVTLLKSRYSSIYNVIVPSEDSMTDLPPATTQILLVIPANAWKDNQDPLRPLFSQSHLDDMAAYLQALASAWTRIQVVNPVYVDVAIAYEISFSVNPDYGYRQLQQALTLEFMPWVTGGPRGVTAGNSIDYYGLIAFVQQQPYVTEVKSLTLNGGRATIQGARNEVLILNGFTSGGIPMTSGNKQGTKKA
jgi:hypothetical protein